MNKIIYSMRVMKQLVTKGFIPLAAMPNPKDSNYQCWVFKDTKEFEAALTEIMGGDKRGSK